MSMRKEGRGNYKFQTTLKFRKGDFILRKGQLTKQCLYLLQGTAYIEQQPNSQNIIHVYHAGDILNQVEVKFSCQMLKNVKCLTKCLVSRASGPVNKSSDNAKDEYNKYIALEQLQYYLDSFSKNYAYVKQILKCSQYKICIRRQRHEIQPGYIYFCKGSFNIVLKDCCWKRIENSTIYPILCMKGIQIYFQFTESSLFFKIRYDLIKYYFNGEEIQKLQKILLKCSPQIFKHFEKRQLRIKSGIQQLNQSSSPKNKWKMRKNQTPQKNLQRSKIMSEICVSYKKFRFSVKSKANEIRKQRNMSLYTQSSTKFSEISKLSKQINLQFCSFHKSQCPNKRSHQNLLNHLLASKTNPRIL